VRAWPKGQDIDWERAAHCTSLFNIPWCGRRSAQPGIRSMRTVFITLALFLRVLVSFADERIWVDAKINDKPARLIFDTGADRLILFRRGAERLGLRISNSPLAFLPPPGAAVMGVTEPCKVTLWRTSRIASLASVEIPAYLHTRADGVLGWQPISQNIVMIDATTLNVKFLSRVPEVVTTWTRLQVQPHSGHLFLKIRHESGRETVVLVDTGSEDGVALSTQRWGEWKAVHTNQPATTLDSYFMPGAGLVVKETRWAEELSLGPLRLTDVPILESNPAQAASYPLEFEASLGLAALKRLDFVFDGKKGLAYVRPKETRGTVPEHNRLGAVFVPIESQSDDLIAHAIAGGPAHDAGVRDGDVLLKIGGLDVTRWRTDPTILPLSRFWTSPPGTKLDLTLKRGTAALNVTVTLRQILSPTAK
jgi:hypothetical protein